MNEQDPQRQQPGDEASRASAPHYGDAPRYGWSPPTAPSHAPSSTEPSYGTSSSQPGDTTHGHPDQGFPNRSQPPQAYPPPAPWSQGHAPTGYPQQGYAQRDFAQRDFAQQEFAQRESGQQGYSQRGYAPPPGVLQPYGHPAYPAQTQTVPPNLAGWARRVGAFLIDFIPSYIAQAVFYVGYFQWIFATTQLDSRSTSIPTNGLPVMAIGGVLLLAALGWQIYNRWITAGRTGRSLGKRVLKIRLVGEAGSQPIGPLNAFLRDLVHVLDGLAYVGYLWPLWDERRQTFADKLMKTYVIDDRAPSDAHA